MCNNATRKRLRVELRFGVSPRQTLNRNGRNARVGKTAKTAKDTKTFQRPKRTETERSIDKNIESNPKVQTETSMRLPACVWELNSYS